MYFLNIKLVLIPSLSQIDFIKSYLYCNLYYNNISSNLLQFKININPNKFNYLNYIVLYIISPIVYILLSFSTANYYVFVKNSSINFVSSIYFNYIN